MLIQFFLHLKEAKVPVSVREFLTLLEALKSGVIAPSIDEFYQLSRLTLVKDEQHFDRFDQVFGSYFKELLLSFKWLDLISEGNAYIKHHRSMLPFKYMSYYMLPSYLKKTGASIKFGSIDKDFYNQHVSGSKLNEMLYNPSTLKESLLEHFEYKLEHNLKWNDLNSMYFSVELREPFLDYRIVEKTLGSANKMLINKGYTKWIYREAMKGILPEVIRLRKDKVGFDNPSDEWLKTPLLKNIAQETLNNKKIIDSQIININNAKKAYQLHLEGKINIARDIWKWISLNYFLNKF